jgi:hypothetical protein
MGNIGAIKSEDQLTGKLSANRRISGKINAKGTLSGRLSKKNRIKGHISFPGSIKGYIRGEQKLIGVIQPSTDTECHHKEYDGEYEVIPKAYEKTVLETNKRIMKDNITVHEIPITIVTNLSGGSTACIG